MKTLLLAVLSLALIVTWSEAGSTAQAATQDVAVQDDEYVDGASGNSTTTITAGDTVQWTWTGSHQHTVDSNTGGESFSSGAERTSGTFSHTFDTPGTYTYICAVHGTSMQGTIVVIAGAEPTNTPEPQETTTPSVDATDTPSPATSTVVPADATPTRTMATASPVATTGAGGAGGSASLPGTGTGPEPGDQDWSWALAGLVLLGAAGAGAAAGGCRIRRRV